MKEYEFTTAGGVTCGFYVTGEYWNGCLDITVHCGDHAREWIDVDAGAVDDMFIDLLGAGVRFESARSLVFNIRVVESVIMDRDRTLHEVLVAVDRMTDGEIAEALENILGTVEITA